jgi:hypothetical protein
MASLRTKVGITDRRLVRFSAEAALQLRVGTEFWRTTFELASMAQKHSSASVHGLDNAAYVDIHIPIFAQLAHFRAIGIEADDSEGASIIDCAGRAEVEEASAIGQFDDVVDVGGDANIFVEEFGGVIGGAAGFGVCGEAQRWNAHEEKYEPVESAPHHDQPFRGMEIM